jgi:hypothetical protein
MIFATLLFACVDGPGVADLAPVDTGAFYAEAEPVLAASCANPSCHGTPERPLQVYAQYLHRADPALLWSDMELTAEEHAANLARSRGMAADGSLWRKPLAPERGGMRHEGGWRWSDTGDPSWRDLRRWAVAE